MTALKINKTFSFIVGPVLSVVLLLLWLVPFSVAVCSGARAGLLHHQEDEEG